MKKLIALVVLVACVSLLALSQNHPNNSSKLYEVHLVKNNDVEDSILASGNFKFSNEIEVRSEVMGIVTKVEVEEGDFVKKGDLLLALDKTRFEADVEQALASVNIQETEIRRLTEIAREAARKRLQLERLNKRQLVAEDKLAQARSQNTIAAINVEAARHRLEQLKAALTQRQDNLQKTKFTAPIDGLVLHIDIKEGETVIAGTTNIVGSSLITLADISTYTAQIRVDEADLASVHLGQAVKIFPAALPHKPTVGKVAKISTAAKSSALGKGLFYHVEVKLNSLESLFPGMSCRAEVLVQEHADTLSVPIEAINKHHEGHFVWVVNKNKAEKRSVVPGISSDIDQVILDGLSSNEKVLIGPSRQLDYLEDGDNIQIKES